MFVWKDENKLKRGRGWPIFKKNQYKDTRMLDSGSVGRAIASHNRGPQFEYCNKNIFEQNIWTLLTVEKIK